MSDLLSADTDYEAAKYDEAATIMDAGFNAEAIKSKKSVFNPEQGVNEILMPMQSGGYVQIGQQSLEVEASLPGAVLIDGIEYGPETAEYQRYYPKKDPSPAAMTEAPAMPAAPEAQADVDIDMGAQVRGVQDYAAQLRDIQGGFSEEDLTAAGYSPQVIQEAGLGVSQVEPIAPLSQEEIQQQLQQGTLSVFTSDPTLRESGSQALTATLTDIALNSLREDLEAEYVSQTGEAIPARGSAEYPRSIQETLRTRENELMGEAEVLSNAVFGHKSGIGVADFATAGIMDIQEGARLFSQGRAENKDSKVDRLLGALLVAAGIAEATGVGMFVGKAIKKSLPSIRSAIEVVGERLNQPGPMPTTSSFGAGAIDDASTAAKEEGIQINPPVQSNPVVDDLPMVDPDSLLGMRIFPIQADLTKAGGEFTGIDSSQIEVPIALQGGPDFPLLQTSKDGSVVWAVDAKGVSSKKLNKDADYALVLAMSPDSHKTNATVNSAMLETTLAYVRDGRITDEAISQIDALIQKPMGQKQLSRMGTFPGLKSPDAASWMRNATFEERNRIMQVMSSPSVQDMGAPNLQKILDATVDPRYVGLNSNDSIMLIKIDREAGSVKLGEEPGTVPHLSYEYGLKGTPVARVPFVAAKNMFPEWFAERTAKEADMLRMGTASSGEALPLKPLSEAEPNVDIQGPPVPMQGPLQPDRPKPPNTARSFQFSLPVGEVTQEVVNNMKSVAMSEVKSPRQAKLLVNALDGDWVTTAQAKNVGGISALDWIKEARSSPESATLTIPSGDNKTAAKALQADINSGMLTLYKLNDSRTYFGIQKEYNYFDEYGLGPDVDYWTPKANGPELTENETALVSVVSNDFGAKGIGATTVMKAIEEGATVLDAFAVKSDKYPSGFLPTFYATFGFREAGRIKFDPNIVLSEPGGELKLKDMKSAWAKRGWKEGDEFPDIVVMKWTGDENGRSQFTRRFVADNSESAGGQKVAGGFAETARSNGQPIADADGRQRRSSIISGSGGDVSNGNRGSAAGKLADVGREVLNATDEQLENLGIDPERVRQLRQEILGNN